MIKPPDSPALFFRPLIKLDVQTLFEEAFSDPETTRYLQWDTHHTIDETQILVKEMIDKHKRGEKYFWIFERISNREPVGLVSVHHDGLTAWIGFIIFKKERRKGYGKNLLSALESSVLSNFDSAKAKVALANRGSIALLASCGWISSFRNDHFEIFNSP